jgi:signal transduction histidine kinase
MAPPGGTRGLPTLRHLGRAIVPVSLAGNVACYLAALWLLPRTSTTHDAQLDDWRIAVVVGLMSGQALWLYWLRRQPVTTALASVVLWNGAMLIGGCDPLLLQPGVLVALLGLASERTGPTRLAVVGLGVLATTATLALARASVAGAGAGAGVADPAAALAADALVALGLVAVPAGLGAWYAQLRDRAEHIAGLAHQIAAGETARTAHAVAAERHHLAQELHDTSSAHLAAIITLTAAAHAGRPRPVHLDGAHPDPAHLDTALLDQIQDESQRLYQGFERLVTRLRQEDRTLAGRQNAGHGSGQHSVTELPGLVTEHHRTVHVLPVLRHDPDLAEIDLRLGPLRSHIAYRVVQEGLSNARKHSPGAPITVLVEDDGSTVLLRIENDAPDDARLATAGSLGLGYGLEGMRDRLASAGGSLRTGPRQNGGWAVHALLPHPQYRESEPDDPDTSDGHPVVLHQEGATR